jgi:hypothetical protein
MSFLHSQSCWYFGHLLWTVAALYLLFDLPHSPPSQSKLTVYTDSVWVALRGGGQGGCWVVLHTIFGRSLTLCFWSDSEPTKLLPTTPNKNISKDDIGVFIVPSSMMLPLKLTSCFHSRFLQGRERGEEEKSRGCERVDQGGEWKEVKLTDNPFLASLSP